MEKILFTWEEWDEVDTMTFVFFNVTLIRDLGAIKAGTHFDSAEMNYDKGKLELYEGENVAATFKLRLEVEPA